MLADEGFEGVEQYDFPTPHTWTLDDFIGYLSSTSFASKERFGGNTDDVEAAVRRALLDYDPSGTYSETMPFYYIVGRAPGAGR